MKYGGAATTALDELDTKGMSAAQEAQMKS
jgi:hypothetical protein